MRCREILDQWPGAITVEQLNTKLKPKTNAHARRYLQALAYIAALNLGAPLPPGWQNLEEVAKADQRGQAACALRRGGSFGRAHDSGWHQQG
jgi:hypothetical protein